MSALSDATAAVDAKLDALKADADAIVAEVAALKTTQGGPTQAEIDAVTALGTKADAISAEIVAGT